MKRYLLSVASLVASLIVSPWRLEAGDTNPPLVSTTGTAEVRVVPDLADLAFQVEIRNADLSQARKEEGERMSRVLAALRGAGVAERELKTSQVEIVPHYDTNEGGFPGGPPPRIVESATVRFYSVSQYVVCTLHDVKKVPNVTADAIAAGTTGVSGATLRTSELRKYRDQARAEAIRAAKEKAVALAGELGVKVGRPYTITENSYDVGQFNAMNSQRSVAAPGNDGGESAFAPGTISVNAHVSVSFLIE